MDTEAGKEMGGLSMEESKDGDDRGAAERDFPGGDIDGVGAGGKRDFSLYSVTLLSAAVTRGAGEGHDGAGKVSDPLAAAG